MSEFQLEPVERYWNRLPDIFTSQNVVLASAYDDVVAKLRLAVETLTATEKQRDVANSVVAYVTARLIEAGLDDGASPVEKMARRAVAMNRQLAKVTRERDAWKASHDNQVHLKRMLTDRPDLKDRAMRISELIAERDKLKALPTFVPVATLWIGTLAVSFGRVNRNVKLHPSLRIAIRVVMLACGVGLAFAGLLFFVYHTISSKPFHALGALLLMLFGLGATLRLTKDSHEP